MMVTTGALRSEIGGIVDEDLGSLGLLLRVLDLHLALELLGQDHDRRRRTATG